MKHLSHIPENWTKWISEPDLGTDPAWIEDAEASLTPGSPRSAPSTNTLHGIASPNDASSGSITAPVSCANAAARSTDQQNEIAFLSGVDSSGRVAATSFASWNRNDPASYSSFANFTAKWQGGAAGSSGGIVYYYFDPSAHWTAAEQQSWVGGLSLWSAIANISFVQTTIAASVNVTLKRNFGEGTYTSSEYTAHATPGSSYIPAYYSSGNFITFDGSGGFGNFGSFTTTGGYGVACIVHEIGHLIGLGHGGPYNGSVDCATQQFGPLDMRLWDIMSYISPSDTDAKFCNQYPVKGTYWGYDPGGAWPIYSPYTWAPLDILAAERLYGMPTSTPLSGGQVFGFNCNIGGALNQFFNFNIDTKPVITLWDKGTNNTLNLSGFSQAATVNLNPGTFSSCDGMINNIAIEFNTKIDQAVGGAGNDKFTVNHDGDTIEGGGGTDTVVLSGSSSQYSTTIKSGLGRCTTASRDATESTR